ncbi:MAG TPA: hypothetical protein VKU00_10540 [Chthonomonadaceae bacterium]|nr:hypothetical protein [Chthonomonadaceae bacterium]
MKTGSGRGRWLWGGLLAGLLALALILFVTHRPTLLERAKQLPTSGNLPLLELNVSPDGKWEATMEDSARIRVQEREGERSFRWDSVHTDQQGNAQALAEVAWLPDSRRWIGRVEETPEKALLFSVDIPGGRGVPVPLPKGTQMLLGITADYRLFTSDVNPHPDTSQNPPPPPGTPPPAPPTALTINTVGLYPNNTPESQVTIPLPANMELHDLVLSPQGDRLLWVFSATRAPNFGAFLTRIFPFLKSRFTPRTVVSLQVSRLDGKDRHEIGYMDGDASKGDPIDHVRWAQDGKRAGFLYNSTLYAVPVD